MNFRREAQLSNQSGNLLTTAVLNGASSESLLRELQLVLMWDEGTSPGAAAEELADTKPITKLARTAFHDRLGGSWNLEGTGPVGDWFRNVAQLRNRVLHMGHEPSWEEVSASLRASTALNEFVRNRLLERLSQYPYVAMFFFGGYKRIREFSKKRREAWKKMVDEFGLGYPVLAFRIWRVEVQKLFECGYPFPSQESRGRLVRAQYGNGEIHYWLVDRDSGLACRAITPDKSTFCAVEGRIIDWEVPIVADSAVTTLPAEMPPKWLPMCARNPRHTSSWPVPAFLDASRFQSLRISSGFRTVAL